jgi:hypothetical protein
MRCARTRPPGFFPRKLNFLVVLITLVSGSFNPQIFLPSSFSSFVPFLHFTTCGERLLTPHPTAMLEYCPLSAVASVSARFATNAKAILRDYENETLLGAPERIEYCDIVILTGERGVIRATSVHAAIALRIRVCVIGNYVFG